MSNEYYWKVNEKSGFRELILNFTHDNIKEIDKFDEWYGSTRKCSKCKIEYPECSYFFVLGGVNKFHRYCKKCEGSPSYGWGKKYNYELNIKGFQYCNKCDRTLPLNTLYFARSNGRCNKTGYSSNCKECLHKERPFGIYSFNNEIKDIQNGFKICQSCKFELPNTDEFFFKSSDKKNGSSTCKLCEGFKYGIQRLNVALKDELPENHRFCSDCRELKYIDEMSNNSLCKSCAIPKRKNYNQKPVVKERLRVARQIRRSREKDVISNLTTRDIDYIFSQFNNCCAYCGMTKEDHYIEFKENLHCEHILPLTNGGFFIYGNIIPACRSCNASKNIKDIFEFYDYSDRFTFDRLEIILNYINHHLHITEILEVT